MSHYFYSPTSFASALAPTIIAAGGAVLRGATVSEIVVVDGVAIGVRVHSTAPTPATTAAANADIGSKSLLSSAAAAATVHHLVSTFVTAKSIVSAVGVRQTYMHLLGPSRLPSPVLNARLQRLFAKQLRPSIGHS
jgi:hypothetical protein